MLYLLSIVIFLLHLSGSAFAQADYRNLDPGRPMVIEDAQPIEFRAFEFQLGLPRYTRRDGGADALSFEPGLTWGFARDGQVGIEGENVTRRDGEAKNSFGDTQIHLLYNLNQESEALPAIALRPEFSLPTGAFGGDHFHAGLKGIASKTFGMNRLHLNGSYTAGPTEAPGRGGDRVSRSLYGIAYERTFPIVFAVVLVDLYAVRPIDGRRAEVISDLGGRVQLTPTWVVDAGLFRALRSEGETRYGFTLGVTTVFSFRRLFPTGEVGGGEE
ncbi:MAG: hypothetical protein EPO39_05955 [Candidatus Manganitrophaceae bacterium]|nr:MAG: hypothetical protein EPO39_05955 [Candidatus Manganitrophaceae bacterium]